jgi:hypothetical protein
MRSSEQITVGALAIKLITQPGGLFDSITLSYLGKDLHGEDRVAITIAPWFKLCYILDE